MNYYLELLEKIKIKGKFWIVFTGDSITSCEWVHPNWRDIVEYVLKEEVAKSMGGDWKTPSWGIRAFNFAYDGSTTADIFLKCGDIDLVRPDLVISLMGGNDPVFGVSVGEHVDNIKKISESLRTKILWCTSTPRGDGAEGNKEYKPYAEAVMNIPETDNFKLIDMFSIYKNFPLEEFFTFKSEENSIENIKEGDPDVWHPNQLGNAYIAKVILKECFGIEFSPEKYINDTLAGEKLPKY